MQPILSPSPHVQAFRDGSIGWLVLNRPARRNALNAEMWAAIPPMMKSLDESIDVRVIVIRGSGSDAFSAGAEEEIAKLATSCFNNTDYAEGRKAFADKRKPKFSGL